MKKISYVARKPDASGFVAYTPQENQTWATLYERQHKVIQGRACREFLEGLEILNMPRDRVPQCAELNARLEKTTGWKVQPVEKMISLETFFDLIANKHFPAATFIRVPEELDYLQEPDIFHEFFGHCPLLTHQAYADFVQTYGKLALQAPKEARSILGRLFWFTIEFGLLKTPDGLRVYGGGILSSFSETKYALESSIPQRAPFDIREVMRSPYRYDEIQKKYFVIESLLDLFELGQLDLGTLAKKVASGTDNLEDFVTC